LKKKKIPFLFFSQKTSILFHLPNFALLCLISPKNGRINFLLDFKPFPMWDHAVTFTKLFLNVWQSKISMILLVRKNNTFSTNAKAKWNTLEKDQTNFISEEWQDLPQKDQDKKRYKRDYLPKKCFILKNLVQWN